VAVRNQFGSDVLRLIAPKVLCAPTAKTAATGKPGRLPSADAIDHFTCYSATSRTKLPTAPITLADQFGRRRVKLLQVTSLCVPTKKNATPSQHPVEHLVCYSVTRTSFRPRRVRATDQFGSQITTVRIPGSLCVPSIKMPL
jgi:hypothetical protein